MDKTLTSLIAEEKIITAEVSGFEGFEVEVCYISKNKLKKIGEKATITKFDSKTRQPYQELDSTMFNKLFCDATIKGWKGLKGEYLEQLVVTNAELDPKEEIEYSPEGAKALLENSEAFDNWLNNLLSDVSNFNKRS